ncbi:MAG: hypothetical protein QXX29_05015, partial [Nitrososphaerota archaeon]
IYVSIVVGVIPSRDVVEMVLKFWLLKLLGNAGLSALEYQLRKILAENPYQAFYENPNKLYEAFRAIFGEGAEALLRILFSAMIREGAIDASNPDEIINLMRRNDEASRRALLRMFRIVGTSRREMP